MMYALGAALLGTFLLGVLGGMAAAVLVHLGSLEASSYYGADD